MNTFLPNSMDAAQIKSPINLSARRGSKTELEKCEDSLADVLHELVSYSYLLRWLGPGADNAENLYGLGLALDRLGRRVARTIDRLNHLQKAAQSDDQK